MEKMALLKLCSDAAQKCAPRSPALAPLEALHEQLKKLLVFNELQKALFAYENFVGLKVVNQRGVEMEAVDHYRAFHIVKALSQNEASLFTTDRKLEVLEQQIAKLVEKLPPLVVERHALKAMIKSKSDLAAKRARGRVDAAQEKLAARKKTQDAKKRRLEDDDAILAQELGEELGGSEEDARDRAEDYAIAAEESLRMFQPEEKADEEDYVIAERKAEEAARVAEAAKALAAEKRRVAEEKRVATEMYMREIAQAAEDRKLEAARVAQEKHNRDVSQPTMFFENDDGLVFYSPKVAADKDDEELAASLNRAFPSDSKV
jgi:hypothetical protein